MVWLSDAVAVVGTRSTGQTAWFAGSALEHILAPAKPKSAEERRRDARDTRIPIGMKNRSRKRRVVVVTGASAGVGRAAARIFAQREGAHIGLIARGLDGLEGAKRDVEALGGRSLTLPCDVADAAALE